MSEIALKTMNPIKSPVRSFVLIVFTLSWPFLICGFGWFASEEDVLARYIFSCTGMLMVAFSAFIVRVLIERKGFEDVGWNLGHYKSYLIALLACFLYGLVPALIALPFGNLEWDHNITGGALIVATLSLAGFSVIAGFGEEFGWRGYLLPRLLTDRRRSREILVIIGFIWGVWHLPVELSSLLKVGFVGTSSWASVIGLALLSGIQMIAASVALSFVFGAVWLKTRSIFLVSFIHGYFIGFRDAFGILLNYPPAFRLTRIFILVPIWIVLYRWLEKYEHYEEAS